MNDVVSDKPVNILHSCARCGEDHPNLDWHEFKMNPVVDEDGTEWEQWATCPTTGDPILRRTVEWTPDK